MAPRGRVASAWAAVGEVRCASSLAAPADWVSVSALSPPAACTIEALIIASASMPVEFFAGSGVPTRNRVVAAAPANSAQLYVLVGQPSPSAGACSTPTTTGDSATDPIGESGRP